MSDYKRPDINESIYSQPTKAKKVFDKDEVKERVTIAYAYSGHKKDKLVNEKDKSAYAKVIHINGRPRYYVKVCKIGGNVGMLPNPKSSSFVPNETSAKIGGIDSYSWQNVKKELFDEYVTFLRTGEQRWVRAAQSRLQS